jgi:hypothetical protein
MPSAEQTRIFAAWSDEPWVNDGAAVRVSLVAFGKGGMPASVDGTPVPAIACRLSPAPIGGLHPQPHARAKAGRQFEECQLHWHTEKRPVRRGGGCSACLVATAQPPRKVQQPWWCALGRTAWRVTRRNQKTSGSIDFGVEMSESDASLFELHSSLLPSTSNPCQTHVGQTVKPRLAPSCYWWCQWSTPRHEGSVDCCRLGSSSRRELAKHRVFAWFSNQRVA